MNNYEKWLNSEKEWIDTYCGKNRNTSLFIVTPLILVGMAVVFGVIPLAEGGDTNAVLEGAVGGLIFGILICAVYLLIMLPNMRPGKYTKKIDKNVAKLGLSAAEKEELGKEMLETDEQHKISYKMVGPKSKGSPARFVLTPHFAFLEGSSPYSILIRLSDIAEIRPAQEDKSAVEYGAKTKTYYNFTLYTIGFYRKDRAEHGLANNPDPDEVMGFFQKDTRDDVLNLLRESDVPVIMP